MQYSRLSIHHMPARLPRCSAFSLHKSLTQYQAPKVRHRCLLGFHHPEFSCSCFSVGSSSGSTRKKTFLVMHLRASPYSFQTYSSCCVFQVHRCLLGCSSQIEILVTSLQKALQTTPLDSSGPIKSWWYYPSNLVKLNGPCQNLIPTYIKITTTTHLTVRTKSPGLL